MSRERTVDDTADRPASLDTDDGTNASVGVGVHRVELHYGAATDVGRVREVNEDSYLADPPVFVVADGMGGHEGGDVASSVVVEEFARLADLGYDARRVDHVIRATLQSAQRRLQHYALSRRETQRSWHGGTTAVVAMLAETDQGTEWRLANLGDSRIYCVEDGELRQVSRDHSLVRELVDAGRISEQEAAVHPERHVITRALGRDGPTEPEFFSLPLDRTERLLLCSDGVSGMIDDAAIADQLQQYADPRDAADRLVAAAVAAGGRDNATAVVVDVMGLVSDDTYDSRRQRESLREKLGTLP